MSRALAGELLVTGTLVTESALCVGSGHNEGGGEIVCLRNGAGDLVIPGSALAGAFRATFQDEQPWGGQEYGSQLYFEDAVLTSESRVEHRDGVMIDRRTGAAAAGMLYGREVIPAGSRFSWELRLEVTDTFDRAAAESWVSAITGRLAAGVGFGGGTSAGLGRVKLKDACQTWIGMGARAELVDFLRNPHGTPKKVQLSPESRAGHLQITVPWRACGPLLVSVPLNGLVDRIPQHTRSGDGATRLVIPGTTLKGVLRSRAEWIVRTIAGIDAPGKPLEQLAGAPGIVAALFGAPPKGRGRARTAGRQGALRVGEVRSKQAISGWSQIVAKLVEPRSTKPGDAGLTERARIKVAAINQLKSSSGGLRISDHVAISRWTGGADDGKLFATVAPLPADDYWQPIELDLDLARAGAGVLPGLALLVFVLRDFCQGWIGIGYGTTRGYGEVTADSDQITWAFGFGLPEELSAWAGQTFTLQQLLSGDEFADLRKRLEDAWRQMAVTFGTTEGDRDAVAR